jgi:hypothetical protein
MTYTVWKNGEKIGETRFELCPGPRKRAGVFHPTAYGLTVLPAITAMAPALLEFGAMCRERGVDVDDDRPETAESAFDAFANTAEGRRIQAAASHIAELELRDSSGRTLVWESIMISDMTALVELAARRKREAAAQLRKLPGDPIRFMISTTLREQGATCPGNPLGASEALGVC